ncbi:hypothetical protein GPECTOR_378g174 [Gonium pectorale]|uniref:Ubiquitin-like domain-containing protein n=1 Tax=Gonium pectorale TaxID=33097 RepID=A0A150FWJ8_GONPE|nr:hypothetical protein GPECTOR_378g174 [Gonium pectorale]|eukprot:KXZ41585.1 hypothetical protein GPECTOR_378g174 [Gonium pectorale]
MKRGRFGTAALNSVVLLLLLLPFAPGELRRAVLQHYRSNATAWLDWLRIIGVVALVLRSTVWPPTRLQALLLMTAAVYGTWDSAEEEEEEEEEGAALDEEGSRQRRHWHWWWRCVMARTAAHGAAEAFPGGAAAVLRVVASLSRIWRPVPYAALLPLLLLAAAGAAGDVVFRMPSGVAAHVNAMSEVAHRCWRCVRSMALWLAPRVLPYVALGAAVGGAAAAGPAEGADQLVWGACWAATSVDADGRPMWRMLWLAAGALRIRQRRAWQRRWRTDSDRSQIFIRTLHGRTVALMVDLARPAVELLLEPAVSEGAPLYLLRLLRGGRSVRPDWSLLRGGVLPGSTLSVTSVLFGGVDFTAAERDAVCAAAVEVGAQQQQLSSLLAEQRWEAAAGMVLPHMPRPAPSVAAVAAVLQQQDAVVRNAIPRRRTQLEQQHAAAMLTGLTRRLAAVESAAGGSSGSGGAGRPASAGAGPSGSGGTGRLGSAQTFTFAAPMDRGATTARQPSRQIAAVVEALQADEELAQIVRRQGRWRSDERQQLVARLRGVLGAELSAKQVDQWLQHHKAAVVAQLGGPLASEVKQGAVASQHRRAPHRVPQPPPCPAGPQAAPGGALEVAAAFPEDMYMETRAALRAVAQLMHVAEDPVQQEALEAWDEREWRTLTAQICAGVKDPESAVAKQPCDDVCAAEQFRVAMAAALPQHVCAVCSWRRRQAEVQQVPLSQLRKWLDEHLDASLPPNEEAPRNGTTRWVPPTAAEAQELLAAGQGATCKEEEAHVKLRAHVVAFKAPTPQQLASVFPCHPDQVPDLISVVFVSPAQTPAEVAALAHRTPAMHVRGKVVARWARHLAGVYGLQVDAQAVAAWEQHGDEGGIPPALLQTAVAAASAEEANALLRLLRADQEGYARTRYGTEEEAAARSGGGSGVQPAQAASGSGVASAQRPVKQQRLAQEAAQWTPAARHILRLVPDVRFGRFAKQQHETPAAKERRLAEFMGRNSVDFKQVAAVSAVPAVSAATVVAGMPEQALLVAEVQSAAPPSAAPRAYGEQMHGKRRRSASAAVLAGEPQAGAAPPSGPMYGVDDVDLITTATHPAQLATVFREAAGNPTAIVKLLQGWPLVTSTASRPESDYDPMWPLFVHVGRFPNGTGARPLGMSFLAWIRLQLQRWYPPLTSGVEDESAHAPHFILDMFDAWQRHEVHRSAAVRLKLYPRLIRELGLMDVGMLLQTSDLLAAGLSRSQLAERLRSAPPAVGKLVQTAHMTAARVAGTPASYASLRSRAYGLWSVFGAPTASFTLNPASVSSEAAFSLMGRPYSFDVKGMQPPRLERILSTEGGDATAQRERLLDFMESIQTQGFASPLLYSADDRPVHALKWTPEVQRECAGVQAKAMGRLTSLQADLLRGTLLEVKVARARAAARPPLRAGSAAEAEALGLFAAEAVLDLLLHRHREGTCTAHGTVATDLNCRMRMPRIIHWATTWLQQQTTCVHLKRHSRWVVAHCVALHLAAPCNHTVAFVCDIGRWLRTVELWDQRHPGLTEEDPRWQQRPRLPSLAQLAADAADYALKYATKAEPMQGGAAVLAAANLLRHRAQLAAPGELGAVVRQPPLVLDVLRELSVASIRTDAAAHAATIAAAAAAPPLGGAAAAGTSAVAAASVDVDALEAAAAAVEAEPSLAAAAGAESAAGLQAEAERAGVAATVDLLRRAAPHGAPAVQREARWNLTHAINMQTAQQTFSAPAAALLILLGRDAVETRQAQPIDYRTFTEHLHSAWERREEVAVEAAFVPTVEQPAAAPSGIQAVGADGAQREGSPLEAVEVTEEEAAAEEAGLALWVPGGAGGPSAFPRLAVHATTRLADYLLRGPHFRYCSPILMAMLAYKRRTEAGQTAFRQLDPQHPEFGTHQWSVYREPSVPQPFSNPTVRPAEGVQDEGLRERYFWDGPQAQQLHVRLARRMLENVNQLALVRMRAEERKLLQAEVQRTAEEAAEAALMEGGHEEDDEPLPYDEEEDGEQVAGRRRADGDVGQLWRDRCLSDGEATALLARFQRRGQGVEGSAPVDPYVAAALAAVRPADVTPQRQLTNAAEVARTAQQCTDDEFAGLTHEMVQYSDSTQTGMGRLTGGLSRSAQEALRLFRPGTAEVTAKLMVVQPDGHEEQQPPPSMWPDSGGSTPPFVRCSKPPSPEDTARLFSLTEDQQEPFLLYAQLLLTEALGPQRKQPPVCSVLTGKAGTGKSRVLQALLWLAFQHDSAVRRLLPHEVPYKQLRLLHRQAVADPSAQQLLEAAETCAGIESVSEADVARLCHDLNGRAVSAQQPLPAEPFVVVQRHSVRVPLAQQLVRLHALAKGQQLLLWRSSDLAPDGTALPVPMVHQLEGLGAEKDQEGTPAVGAFFNGVRYYFTDNERVALHHVHNNGATGE